jgi:hypothetical protein
LMTPLPSTLSQPLRGPSSSNNSFNRYQQPPTN